jgi:hypothetical protein
MSRVISKETLLVWVESAELLPEVRASISKRVDEDARQSFELRDQDAAIYLHTLPMKLHFAEQGGRAPRMNGTLLEVFRRMGDEPVQLAIFPGPRDLSLFLSVQREKVLGFIELQPRPAGAPGPRPTAKRAE